jgi:NAD(P)-dependent dehydrogenase (short-subunit alcohol dehydrogenase family)
LGGDLATLVDARGKRTPMKRMGTAWDTAYAALFLASVKAAYATGTEIVVDGGVSALSG